MSSTDILLPKSTLFSKLHNNCLDVQETGSVHVIHDGPPYANGHLHVGHALNKIIKDITNNHYRALGTNVRYVPGWDCHGLPIEVKVEEEFKKKGFKRNEVPVMEFRKACREYAAKWVNIQMSEFKAMGIKADWNNHYTTMNSNSEATIASVMGKFLMNGSLYRGLKPVMWSPVEATALAESEIEQKENVVKTAYIAFERSDGSSFVAWTTTPWTIPANAALAINSEVEYTLFVYNNKKYIVASNLLSTFENHKVVSVHMGYDFINEYVKHPLYEKTVPVIHADFVTTSMGTGCVHIAPAHGIPDFQLAKTYDLPIIDSVDDNGLMLSNGFEGQHVYTATDFVFEKLGNKLVMSKNYTMTQDCSWRSLKPVIVRTTPQWFISMDDENQIRKRALESLDGVKFIPEVSRNRLVAMVKDRPDWCVSRQRMWGIPIPVFTNRHTLEVLRDEMVLTAVVESFRIHTSDVWYDDNYKDMLSKFGYNPDDYIQNKDVMDVWFESGASYSYVVDNAYGTVRYIEGSDQHRGWFQSALLVGIGSGHNTPPFNAIQTHGHVLTENGSKMSKSASNGLSPDEINKKYGPDVLRIWAALCKSENDVTIGKTSLDYALVVEKKLRTTLKWLHGNLINGGYVDTTIFEPVDHFILNKIYELDQRFKNHENIFVDVYEFCCNELSSLFFDIVKDTLYCDDLNNPRRQRALYVIKNVFERLLLWISPVTVFMVNDVLSVYNLTLVHTNTPESWKTDIDLTKVFELRSKVLSDLEKLRQEKKIGSSLQASVSMPNLLGYSTAFWAELFIVSNVVQGEYNVFPASGKKCPRCWKVVLDKCLRCI